MSEGKSVSAKPVRPEERADRDARDLELINAYADELNAEPEDVLGYQDSEASP
jgi:hypothetical protein